MLFKEIFSGLVFWFEDRQYTKLATPLVINKLKVNAISFGDGHGTYRFFEDDCQISTFTLENEAELCSPD